MAIISKATIEEVRSRSSIVEVISEYLPELRKRGGTYKCCCPFHKEKTPSFTVNNERQIYHCFGCGASGDVFSFVMEYEKIEFVGAVQILADRAGVEVVFDGGRSEKKSNKDILLKLNSEASNFYHRVLEQGKEGEVARRYMQERELPSEIIKEFQIGYAPDGWDGLLSRALKKGYKIDDLEKAGLVVQSDRSGKKSHYDRFRGRIMFPICDPMGRVIGFSGRIMNRADRGAKYVNSPETLIFKKSQILFAFDKARKSIVDCRQAIIVEGQIDAIRCHQVGILNTVASQGTALTVQHANLIKRYCDEVILVFDSDSAGVKAALTTSNLFASEGLSVRVASLPSNEDPDSLIRNKGVQAFKKLIEESFGALVYLINQKRSSEDQKTEVGRLRVIKAVLEYIRNIESATHRDSALKEASNLLDISVEAFKNDLNKVKRLGKEPQPQVEHDGLKSGPIIFPKEEIELLELFVHHHKELKPLIEQYLPFNFLKNAACRTLIESLLEKKPAFLVERINELDEELRQCLTRVQIGISKKVDSEVSAESLAKGYILFFWKKELENELTGLVKNQSLTAAEKYKEQTRLKQDLGMLKFGWNKAVLMIESRLNT